jgi:hypothetical protein
MGRVHHFRILPRWVFMPFSLKCGYNAARPSATRWRLLTKLHRLTHNVLEPSERNCVTSFNPSRRICRPRGGNIMIGKMTLAAALLVGTAAFAQQPTRPETPSAPPSTQQQPNAQSPSQGQCWDVATSQVRPRGTVGAGGNQPGTNPSGPQNQQAPSGSTAQRPAGMPNC